MKFPKFKFDIISCFGYGLQTRLLIYVTCKSWRKHSKTKTIWRKKVQYNCLKIISRFLHDFKDNVSNFSKEFKVGIQELFFRLNFTCNQFGKSNWNIKIFYTQCGKVVKNTTSALFLRKSQHFFPSNHCFTKEITKDMISRNFLCVISFHGNHTVC